VTKVEWRSVYLPRELPEDAIRKAVNNHPDFQEQPGMTEAARIGQRLRYADFFTRTGLYDIAKEELDRILRDFPGQKERVVERQKAIARLGAREDFERLKRLHLGGRYKEVHDRLFDEKNKFPMDDLPDDTLASFRELKAEYEGVKERSDRAVKYLAELAPQVETQYREMFTEAAKSIKDDVYYENLARLDTFLSQAKQAEKQVKAGKKPDLNPSDLMGLAITGWLLGNGAAEANPGVAAKLWRTRQMLVEYLHTASGNDRKKLLEKYLAERQDSTALDDITRIIPTLPPIEPEAKITEKTVEVQLGRNNRGPTYALKLPPDYRHSRPYPVLIVLHKEGEKPGAMIDKWKDQAAENGYILAAPEWETRNNLGLYTYGDNNEHEAVLETVRDLRRRFQVDSDRVFLFGQGQGANMAHDVALSHPDLFAGVSSMGVNPEYHALHYWRNGQYLPFYMVTGTSSGKAEENVHKLFENWVSGGNRPAHSYPMLWVQYKNRGADWFGGEVVNLFDWMRAKRRAFPLHQLGTDGLGEAFGDEFFTVRATDNHFYWLSTDNLDANNLIPSFTKWRKLPRAPRMTAIVDRPKNEIRVAEQGLKQITIWLGRNAKGESMVDFDKPVMIRINGTAPTAKTLTPSATVLLEDLYNRGDRQRLFLAKVEIGQ
jgi:pimeloyl-ACP methyl ester carboxylesterase